MLQLDRTRQPQFEEGFGEGGGGHWPRYRPRLISANVQIGAVLLCKGAKVKNGEGLGPGLGLEIRVARRLRGLVEQREAELKGGSIGRPDD
jgi:hypothetical protein